MEYNSIHLTLEEIKSDQARNTEMIIQAIHEIKLLPNPSADLMSASDPEFKEELKQNPESDKQEKWLLTEDLEDIFKKSKRTIYTWRRDGKISFTQIGRTVYFNKKDVDRLLIEGPEP